MQGQCGVNGACLGAWNMEQPAVKKDRSHKATAWHGGHNLGVLLKVVVCLWGNPNREGRKGVRSVFWKPLPTVTRLRAAVLTEVESRAT